MANSEDRRPEPKVERVAEDPRRYPWPPEAVALLGTMPDLAVANRLGLHHATVFKERRRRGIPAFRRYPPAVEWTDEMVALLGKATDPEVAAELGLGVASVWRKRKLLGIEAFRPRPGRPRRRRRGPHEVSGHRDVKPPDRPGSPPIERNQRAPNQFQWPERLGRLLGQATDDEVAALAGVVRSTVAAERRRRGIPGFHRYVPPVEWTDEMVGLLGEATDPEVAAELGLPVSCVGYKRRSLGIAAHGVIRRPPDPFWTRERVALLGTESDKKLARRLGVPPGRVIYQRRRQGIPPFKPRAPRVVWTAAMVRELGTIGDGRLAKKYGISQGTIRAERQRRGIPPVRTNFQQVARTPELAEVLGSPTKEVVRRTGLSKGSVHRLRVELGIARPARYSVWTPEALDSLGEVPDEELAKRLGLSPSTVRMKRTRRGIRFRVVRRWTEEEDELVRTLSPGEAVRATGRSLAAVYVRRRPLGVSGGR